MALESLLGLCHSFDVSSNVNYNAQNFTLLLTKDTVL